MTVANSLAFCSATPACWLKAFLLIRVREARAPAIRRFGPFPGIVRIRLARALLVDELRDADQFAVRIVHRKAQQAACPVAGLLVDLLCGERVRMRVDIEWNVYRRAGRRDEPGKARCHRNPDLAVFASRRQLCPELFGVVIDEPQRAAVRVHQVLGLVHDALERLFEVEAAAADGVRGVHERRDGSLLLDRGTHDPRALENLAKDGKHRLDGLAIVGAEAGGIQGLLDRDVRACVRTNPVHRADESERFACLACERREECVTRARRKGVVERAKGPGRPGAVGLELQVYDAARLQRLGDGPAPYRQAQFARPPARRNPNREQLAAIVVVLKHIERVRMNERRDTRRNRAEQFVERRVESLPFGDVTEYRERLDDSAEARFDIREDSAQTLARTRGLRVRRREFLNRCREDDH